MTNKFSKAMGLAEASPANIENTLIVARPDQPEQRTRKVHTFLKPSEHDAFVALIGRKPMSHALRELVLDFTARNAKSDR